MTEYAKETYNQSLNMILAAMTLLATLAWRDVVFRYIDKIVQKSDNSFYLILYACCMTLTAIIAGLIISRLKM